MKFKEVIKAPLRPKTVEQFNSDRESGSFVECPCCGVKHNQIYKRQIYKSILKGLKILASNSREIAPSSVGDFSKLRYWGMIQYEGKEGVLRVTEDGHAFLRGIISVPKYAFIQNNKAIGFSDERIFIYQIDE